MFGITSKHVVLRLCDNVVSDMVNVDNLAVGCSDLCTQYVLLLFHIAILFICVFVLGSTGNDGKSFVCNFVACFVNKSDS